MRILVAPDSFTECLSAEEAALAIASGLSAHEVQCLPLADGGEGTAGILTRALGGETISVEVTGPLGTPVTASYGRIGDMAVMDVASACGLSLVPPAARNPLNTTTRGVGELLKAALGAGCRKIVIGLGGSATCDGGAGMMAAIDKCPDGVEIQVLCDVDNPFLGPSGAARIFGPQKGAGPAEVEILEERMRMQAKALLVRTGIDVSEMKGAGAAGGLGGALAALFGARLCPGIDTVLDLVGFSRMAEGSDLIITGEGTSDAQTLSGKVPLGVLRHSGGVPVVLISGRIRDAEALLATGFSRLIQATPDNQPLVEALRPEVAKANLRLAATRGCNSTAD